MKKIKEYPMEIIPKKIKDSNVEIIGVWHTKRFFNEYKEFYERKINESSGIVLEQSVGGEVWECEFFDKLGEIAYKKKIPIYQTDPINKIALIDCNNPLTSVFGGILMGMGFYKNARKIISKKITRKEFFKNVGLNFFGASIFYGSFWPYAYLTTKVGQSPKIYLFAYGQTDWRNIKIAEGIDKICEKENLKKITAFHGEFHTKSIDFYLDNPEIRKIKDALYTPLNICGIKGIRKYISASSKKDLTNYHQSWKLEKVF
jgi:hypothetical protein